MCRILYLTSAVSLLEHHPNVFSYAEKNKMIGHDDIVRRAIAGNNADTSDEEVAEEPEAKRRAKDAQPVIPSASTSGHQPGQAKPMDYFKDKQLEERQASGWRLQAVNETKVPPAHRARTILRP